MWTGYRVVYWSRDKDAGFPIDYATEKAARNAIEFMKSFPRQWRRIVYWGLPDKGPTETTIVRCI